MNKVETNDEKRDEKNDRLTDTHIYSRKAFVR